MNDYEKLLYKCNRQKNQLRKQKIKILEYKEEIERLNNIINELDERCNDMIKFWKTFTDEEKFNNWKEYRIYETILKWIEELKGE